MLEAKADGAATPRRADSPMKRGTKSSASTPRLAARRVQELMRADPSLSAAARKVAADGIDSRELLRRINRGIDRSRPEDLRDAMLFLEAVRQLRTRAFPSP